MLLKTLLPFTHPFPVRFYVKRCTPVIQSTKSSFFVTPGFTAGLSAYSFLVSYKTSLKRCQCHASDIPIYGCYPGSVFDNPGWVLIVSLHMFVG